MKEKVDGANTAWDEAVKSWRESQEQDKAVAKVQTGPDVWRPTRCMPGGVTGKNNTEAANIMVKINRMDSEAMELTYAMPKPVTVSGVCDEEDTNSGQTWERVIVGNAPCMGAPGEPVLPVVPVRLILPQGYELESVTVVKGKKISLEGTHNIEPGQEPVPLTAGKSAEFTPPDPAVYGSDRPYPGKQHDVVTVQRQRGVTILVVNLHPVEYLPKSGKVSYYDTLDLKVKTKRLGLETLRLKAARGEQSIRFRRNPLRPITRDVENPEMLKKGGYSPEVGRRRESAMTGQGSQGAVVSKSETGDVGLLGLCDPSNSYQYVVVTSQDIRDATTDVTIRDLVAHKQARGLTATIVNIEDILSAYSGADDPEKLRNFIIDAYNNWDTDFVLLGGDTGIIPMRQLWCTASGYTADIPSDVYYQCLDGNYNWDGDSQWGEPTDGEDGGDVDLMAEIYIGRASAETAEEMSHFVYKTLAYENEGGAAGYFQTALMCGEYLGFGGPSDYAKQSMEEIRLGADTNGYATVGFAACEDFTVETLYDADGTWSKSAIVSKINSGVYSIINHLGHANSSYVMKFYNSDADALTNANLFFGYSQGCIPGAFDYDCIAEHLTTSHRHGAFAVVYNSRYGWGRYNSTDGPSQRFDRQFWDAYFGEQIFNIGALNADSHEDNIWCINDSCIRWCFYESNLLGDPHTLMRGQPNGPVILFSSVTLDDSAGGNGDGLINPGESVDLTVVLQNVGFDCASNVSATLSTTNFHVTITDNSAAFGDISGAGAAKTALDPYTIQIASGCPTPHTVELDLTIGDETGTNFWTESFQVMVYTSSQISGLVTLDGSPVEGATVQWVGPLSGSVQTEADGTYMFGGISGTYTLMAWLGDGLETEQVEVTIPPNVENVNFALTTATISGRVTDLAGGVPVQAATVEYSGGLTGSVETAADGTYVITRTYGQTCSLTLVANKRGVYSDSDPQEVTVPPDVSGIDFQLGAPVAPTNVNASDGAYIDKVVVAWNAVSSATGYEVWRHTNDNAESGMRIAEMSGATSTNCDDTSVTREVLYYYWVKATNEFGRSGFSDPWDTGIASITQHVWSVGSCVLSCPVIGSNGTIYVGCDDGYMYAFNPDGTTQHVWTVEYGTESSPVIGSDGTIYMPGWSSQFYAFNPDGTTKHVWTLPYGTWSSPAVGTNGIVYIGAYDDNFYAFNPDGTTQHVWDAPGCGDWMTPAIGADGTIYVGSWYDNFYAFNPDGTTQHVWYLADEIYSSPAIGSDGTIYVGTEDGNLYALNPDGTTQQTWRTEGWFYSSPAIGSDGTIYIGSDDGYMYAFNPDGTTQHVWTVSDGTWSSPAISSDGTIYIGSWPGTFYAFNPDGTTQRVWNTGSSSMSSPTIGSDGTIYIGSNNDRVYAFNGTGGGLATNAPWPKFHNDIRNTGRNTGSGSPTPVPPSTPTGLSASDGIYTNKISVTWNSAAHAIGYELYRSTNSDSGTATFLTPITAGANYDDTSAIQGTLYYYWVKAINTVGASAFSACDSGWPALSPPTGVSATDGTYIDKVRVSWTESAGATGYEVWRNTNDNAESGLQVAEVSGEASTNYDDTTAVAGSTYYYWLKVTNSLDTSGFSSSDYGHRAIVGAPASPTNVIASDRTYADKVVVTWNAVTNATGYEVWRHTTSDFTFATNISGSGVMGTNYDDTTVTRDVLCYYWVKATNGFGTSGFSDPWDTGMASMTQHVWTTASPIDSSPAIGSDGTIYVSSGLCLYAFNPDGTTQHVWTTAKGVSSPVIGSDGTIYVGADNNRMYAFNPDGTTNHVWGTSVGVCTPAIGSDGTIYICASAWMYAFSPDGSTERSWGLAGYVYGSPAVGSDGTIYVAIRVAVGNDVYAFSPDGNIKHGWRRGAYELSSFLSIGTGGTIYVGAYGAKLYAFNPDGTTNHVWALGGATKSSPAICSNGTIYVGVDDGKLYALNPDGTTQHVWTTAGDIDSSPAIGSDGTIYVGSADNNFYAFNPDGTTNRIWTTGDSIYSSPAIGSNGTVYVGSMDGNLYAFNGTGAGLATDAPWPKYQHDIRNTGHVSPYVSMSSVAPDPTRDSPISVTLTFTENVTGFTNTDITAGNAAIADFVSASASNYTFNLVPSGQGLITADIAAGVCVDSLGNGNMAAQFSRVYDSIEPSVSISSVAPDPTKDSPVPVTVLFTENAIGFTNTDITVGNGNVADFVTVSASNYTLNLVPSGQGLVTVDIAAGVCQDSSANSNTASAQFSRTYDSVQPSVSMSSTAPDPTRDSPILVTVLFTENVTGFTNTDIAAGNGTVADFATISASNYTFSLVPSGQGLVTADIAAGVCQDSAANSNLAAAQFTRTYDSVQPGVSMSSTAQDPTKDSPIPVTVIFTESVTGFTNTDISAGNGTIANFATVSASNYTFNLVPSGEGTVTADIAAGACQDSAANSNTAAVQFSRVYDITPPTPDPLTWQTPPTALSPTSVWMSAVSAVDTSTPPAYLFTNITAGAISGWQTGSVWTNNGLNVNTRYGFRVKARDAATNETAWSSTNTIYTHANVPLAPAALPVGTDRVRVTLNAAVTGGIYNADGNPSNTQYAVGIITNEGATNYVNFSGGLTNNAFWGVFTNWGGTSGVVVTNLDCTVSYAFLVKAKNQDDVATVFGPSTNVTFDPRVILNTLVQTNDGSGLLYINVTVSNPKTNDCLLRMEFGYYGEGTGNATNTAWLAIAVAAEYGTPLVTNAGLYQITDISTTNFTNTLTFAWDTQSAGNSPSLAQLYTNVWVGFRLYDPVTNLTSSTERTSVWVDNNQPTCTIDRTGASPTNATTVGFSIVFSEIVTNFSLDDIELLTNGTSGELSTFSGSGTGYTVEVVNVTGDGSLGIQVDSNKCTDLFGNANAGVVSTYYTIDQTPPSVAISDPSASITNSGPVTYTVTYSGADTVSLTTNDVSLNMTSTANGTITVSGTGTATRIVTISEITGDGTLGITLAQNTAQDTAGNQSHGITGTSFTVDNTAPSVTMSSTAEDLTTVFPITVTVMFSESVADFSIGDIKAGNGTAGNLVTISASDYTFELTPSGQGTFTADIDAGAAHDAAGNENTAAVQFSRDYGISTPSNVSASDGTYTDKVRVTWDSVEGARGYEVWRNTSNNAEGGTRNAEVSETTYDDTSAEIGFVCYYWVKAKNSLGTSAFSNSDSGWRRSAASTDNAGSDMDGDGLVDMTVYHKETGYWYTLLSASGEVTFQKFGETGYSPVPGDYDGDGKTDLAVYHEASGYWFVLPSSTYSLAYQKFGEPGYAPVSGDFDGDGKTDLTVYHEESGYWYVLPSATYALAYMKFGEPGYAPVSGDFDGDGKTDLTVYHEESGYWFVLPSATYALAYMKFGEPGYAPVSGDFDGDGKSDLAVYHEASGYWYVLSSASGTLSYQKLGGTGYEPVPADYDSDGKADLAVYHEASGYWYILLSESETISYMQFGGPGYIPVGIFQ